MNRLLSVGRMLGRRRGFISKHQFCSYSLPHEVAEKIKSQLDYRDARLLTPEGANPSSVYKGLVILAAGPIAKYPALKHFSAPYLEFGLPVITMNNGKAAWAFCTPAERRMSRVFDVVSANLTDPCPVVVKVYCSGITTYFAATAAAFSKSGCKLNLVGAIFDSGPPTMTPKDIVLASKFFSLQNRYSNWFHKMKELSIPLLLATLNGWRKRAALERVMFSSFLHHTPQLYVYSTSDDIIKPDYINKLIDSQRQNNADVTKYTFSDTHHMLHRLKYPKEYDELLIDFLRNKCSLQV